MHKKFEHKEIEKKWQKIWKESGIYNVGTRDLSREKEYVLVEWPYPSGNLHIGHWFAFAVVDIYVRAHRMQGKQVLFPMGFDAFGLPAENAAIKRNLDPRAWTESNIVHMREQLEQMGNAFSWDKTTSSTDEEYFEWTQWIFTRFFEKDIAFRGEATVNWCPGCNTVIANEQVLSDGTCERSGDVVDKRSMMQWMLKITDYADRLINDLEPLDWPDHIKESQKQWIGRSSGAEIPFTLSTGDVLSVFTTRPDTLYGATYLVLAPEHDFIIRSKNKIQNWESVIRYSQEASQKDDIARLKSEKEKTGIKLEGITATNPANGEEIPVFIADYVLKGYGTGIIMAVPAHDERDYAFATKFNLPIKQVVVPCANDSHNPPKNDYGEVKRDTIIVHLRNKSTGKFALLNWHESLEGITTAIMGGIEQGQTAEEAVINEINEEAGLKNIKIIHRLPWVTAARYCASHKNENRCAHSFAFIAEVENLNNQEITSQHEQNLHSLMWVEESEVLDLLTPDHQKQVWKMLHSNEVATAPGYLMNSEEFDGMNSEEAKVAITEKVGGKMKNTYRLRDWSIGRQRYWGVPIPIVYDPEGKPHVIPKEYLPWKLPTDVDFKPTGEAPLAKSSELKERVESIFGKGWTPEVETMDTFVDSSWYFFRYLDAHNTDLFSSKEKQNEWMPIDIYFGGSEHNTMHLLYSRFFTKVLYDLGLSAVDEPYKKRINRGLVLGPDGNKMSKSKGNVIDPDEQVSRLGADTVKMYLAFMGPYGEMADYPWDMGGIVGLRRFLERAYGLSEHITESNSLETARLLHKTIDKITRDIEQYKFNTAISALMIFINAVEKIGISNNDYTIFLKLLAPFAPHLSEELWSAIGNKGSIHQSQWPVAEEKFLLEETATIGVQINGKMRGSITVAYDADEASVVTALTSSDEYSAKIHSEIARVIYIKNKLINIILSKT
ncbi:MAG: class I tRNA ligase family protein [Candidatus Pacebacteria bacterium]|nr:class I tRNA ligase family protein [Candidatus Paceibacterota bacterium]MCF7857050.1 class I tRNA ligase family protein [Candidatus Paceibacterota bacterium]